ncbi:MAG: ThuA domain-containing protein [Planctomycetota bacterium]|nr:ThuA domain-containing protein [Planctomycetota bacterium]
MTHKQRNADRIRSRCAGLAELSYSFFILLALASGMAMAAGEESKIPGIMVPELATVTPEMIAQITAACPDEPVAKPEKPRRILIFSRCENFTHHSITVAEKALAILGEKTKAWSVEITYDYGVFDAAKLAAYDAIVLNNCQNMLFPEGAARQALLDFVRNGKGIVALHSAIDNFGSDDLSELRVMMGGCSAGHPWGHYLTWRFKVEEPKHPITAHLSPDGFSKMDAMFQFDTRTGRHNVRVLVSMDMSDPTTAKDENGKQRGFRTDGLNPVVWVRHEGKGRVFVNCFGNNNEIFWDASLLKMNLAGIQYAIGDLKADDAVIVNDAVTPNKAVTPKDAVASKDAGTPKKSDESTPAAGSGLKACWWNNNSFTGEPVLTNVVSNLNPVVNSPSAPFPAATPPLGPENVSARFTGVFTPKVAGEYKFVANADDYVALWVNGVEEIAWSGHTAQDRFSARSFNLVKGVPLDIRMDYRQDKLGYKLTLRLAHQPDGEQSDFGPAVGEFTHSSETKTMKDSRWPEGAVVQVDVSALLNARPVTTLTAGKLVTWTMGIDGGGKGSGYLTMAAAQAVGDKEPKALPDNPLIPASESRPEMLLHYSNEDGKGNQACVVANEELTLPVTKKKYRHMFLAWTSAEGSSQIKIELGYSDGTSDARTVTIPDYYNDAPANNSAFSYVVRDLAKWGPTNKMSEANHHNIHAIDIAPDVTRELASIKIAKEPGRSYLLFWAATGVAGDK